MKYIRTKDRIVDLSTVEIGETSWESLNEYIAFHQQQQVETIKQADTIEELCDEFVFIDEFFKREHRLAYPLENAVALCKCHDVDITTLKGAIWTDKGLIYVAKMNEKGELDLL